MARGVGIIDIGADKRLISMDSGAFPSLLSRRSGKKKLEKNRVRLRTVCRNQDGTTAIDGEAVVLPRRN